MSIWMSASWFPNICSASCFASIVLPTPVGPTNRNDPIGRRGSFRSARERRSARATDTDAMSCPITAFWSSNSIASSFSFSFFSIRESGMPVQSATTCIMRSSSMAIRFSSRVFFHCSMICSCLARSCFSWSRNFAASSKCCSAIAFSFCPQIASISFVRFSTSGGRTSAPMRAREPASSITSIALSGRKRPVM